MIVCNLQVIEIIHCTAALEKKTHRHHTWLPTTGVLRYNRTSQQCHSFETKRNCVTNGPPPSTLHGTFQEASQPPGDTNRRGVAPLPSSLSQSPILNIFPSHFTSFTFPFIHVPTSNTQAKRNINLAIPPIFLLRSSSQSYSRSSPPPLLPPPSHLPPALSRIHPFYHSSAAPSISSSPKWVSTARDRSSTREIR